MTSKLLSSFFFVFCLFKAAPAAYGVSQARGPIGATAAGLCHSHSNAGSEPHLLPTQQLLWQCRILNPLSEARDQTRNLMVPSRICFHRATTGTPRTGTYLLNSPTHNTRRKSKSKRVSHNSKVSELVSGTARPRSQELRGHGHHPGLTSLCCWQSST